MPIWLRKFTFTQIKEYNEAQTKALNSQTQSSGTKNLVNPDGTVNTPDFKKASEPYKGKTSYK